MINRKSLAIAIPILFSATTSVSAIEIFNKSGNKIELYGNINPNHQFSHKFLSKKIESQNDNTNSILGFSGIAKINKALTSYAIIEYKTNLFSPENFDNKQLSNTMRLGYAGFKYGNWGSIDYGRNYGIFHDVESLTDRAPYIIKNSAFANNDIHMIGRNNSLLTYRNENFFGLFDGLSLALQYQGQSKNQTSNKEDSASWGASIKYKTDVGLTAIGSGFSAKKSKYNEVEKKIEKLPSINGYGLGFKYNSNDMYFAAFYGAGSNLKAFNVNDKNDSKLSESYVNKMENIEAIAEYNFHSGFYPSLSYLDSKGKNDNVKGESKNNVWELAKQINISTRYEFNKNVSTYMNYKINLLKTNSFTQDNNVPTDNIIGAGIVYQF